MELLVNKFYVNEGILRGQNLSFKCCQPLKLLIYIERRYRSFHTAKKGSVGQRATKLPFVKFENDSNPVRVEPRPTGLSGTGAKQ